VIRTLISCRFNADLRHSNAVLTPFKCCFNAVLTLFSRCFREYKLEPTAVRMLLERRIKATAAFLGKNHTVIQTSYGLYSSGGGERGQLGHGPEVTGLDEFR